MQCIIFQYTPDIQIPQEDPSPPPAGQRPDPEPPVCKHCNSKYMLSTQLSH